MRLAQWSNSSEASCTPWSRLLVLVTLDLSAVASAEQQERTILSVDIVQNSGQCLGQHIALGEHVWRS
jgi:hypothetical protein